MLPIPQDSIGLSLIASPQHDPITRLRLEHKFEYTHTDTRKIESILEVNHQPVFHAGRESLVNSIYFDSPNLVSFHENLAGISQRFKLRLRWYDSPLPGRHCFFEVKRRINRATAKDRYEICAPQPLHQMSLKRTVEELIRILPGKAGHLLGLRPEPIVLVQYRRRHFRVRDSHLQIRMTLDRDIVAVSQIGALRASQDLPVALEGRMILEVKTAMGQSRYVPRLLLPLRPRISRFSKYVMSCARLGAVNGIRSPLAAGL